MTESKGFQGRSVAAFESRLAGDMARLIERHGGRAFVAASMREVPLDDNREALAFGDDLLRGRFDLIIFLTGVGARTLIDVLRMPPRAETRGQSLADRIDELMLTLVVNETPQAARAAALMGLSVPTIKRRMSEMESRRVA